MRALALLLALLLPALLPTLAQAQSCPQGVEPRVTLKMVQDPPVPNNSYGIAQLKQLAHSHSVNSTSSSLGRHIPLGLTAVQARFQSGVKASLQGYQGRAEVCAVIKELTVDVRFADTTVYVATELPANSCIYQQVLEHENTHVAIDRQLLQDWQEQMRYDARQAISAIGPVRAASEEAAMAELSRLLNPYLERSMQKLMAERERRHAQLDTPQEYARVAKSCNGEIRKYLRQGSY